MDELYHFNFKLGLSHKLSGVDFSSCFEYSYCINELNIQKQDIVLDAGSLKSCFPLFLVNKGAMVTSLDIDERVMVQKKYAKKLGIINDPIEEVFNLNDDPKKRIASKSFISQDRKFNIIVCDARKINLPSSIFDFVTCISAIEHIPGDGDISAMKEFERILKPGGKLFISVPYRQKYNEGQWGRWFQRDYNYDALKSRFIQPSNLILKKIGFLVDNDTRQYSDIIYYKLPRLIRFALQWSQYFFARYYIEKDSADKDDAWVAWLLFEKRRE